MNWIANAKKFLTYIKKEAQMCRYIPTYKVTEILKDKHDNYVVAIQVMHKSCYFYAKPEELLSDDKVVDQFSPRDVRTLTYLGYLEINSPKYQILAKKLAEGSDRFIFALKKRGQQTIITKTAEQILNEQDIITSMNPSDARTIGYTVAIEDIKTEMEQKKAILESKGNDNEYSR